MIINDVRTALGAANVLVADVGDEMQGSLLSNLGMEATARLPTIGYLQCDRLQRRDLRQP